MAHSAWLCAESLAPSGPHAVREGSQGAGCRTTKVVIVREKKGQVGNSVISN